MAKILSNYGEKKDFVRVLFHEKPPEDVPEWDMIEIRLFKGGEGKAHWIHEEEALTLISGLSQGVVEIMTRKPIRESVLRKQRKTQLREFNQPNQLNG